jgi:hypothetical protein
MLVLGATMFAGMIGKPIPISKLSATPFEICVMQEQSDNFIQNLLKTTEFSENKITCEPSPFDDALDSAVRIQREFKAYPPALFARAGCERIVLCTNLAYAGQLRAAIPDWEHNTLYIDTQRGSKSSGYPEYVLHHEFFHLIDRADDGDVYSDPEWSALNPIGFHYGTGGVNAQTTRNTGTLTDKIQGFLTHYATTGVEEDKADLFAYIITHKNYISARMRTDITLRAKVTRLKALLVDFCPDAKDLLNVGDDVSTKSHSAYMSSH